MYSTTHLKVKSATLFTVNAINSHIDLTSLAELRVEETVLSSREAILHSGVFLQQARLGSSANHHKYDALQS